MLCGKCEQYHATVAEVKRCYGIPVNTGQTKAPDPTVFGDPGDGPTDRQWEYYKDLATQLGSHVSDNERRLYTFSSIKPLISEMIERVKLVKSVAPSQVKEATARCEVPEGRYATPSLTGNNDLDFWKVDRPTEGKWKGYLFVNRVIGGKPDAPVRGSAKAKALEAILNMGIEESRTLFGQKLGYCWRCGRHLTDETSRANGIGPDCRAQEGM